MAQGSIQAISQILFEEFQQALPLPRKAGVRKPADTEIRSASQAALQQFYEAAKAERLRHGLGVIGRARVALHFQKRLLQAGYPPLFVKQVLFALLTSAFIGR